MWRYGCGYGDAGNTQPSRYELPARAACEPCRVVVANDRAPIGDVLTRDGADVAVGVEFAGVAVVIRRTIQIEVLAFTAVVNRMGRNNLLGHMETAPLWRSGRASRVAAGDFAAAGFAIRGTKQSHNEFA